MGTIYTLLTGMSIVGIEVVDIILSLLYDAISFSIAWKIGGLGFDFKSRSFLHWTARIGIYVFLVINTQKIFL